MTNAESEARAQLRGAFQSLVAERLVASWDACASPARRLAMLHVVALFATLDAFGTLGFLSPTTAKRLRINWRTGIISPSQIDVIRHETEALLRCATRDALDSRAIVSRTQAMLRAIGVRDKFIGDSCAFDHAIRDDDLQRVLADGPRRASIAQELGPRRTLLACFAHVDTPNAVASLSCAVEELVHWQLFWLAWEFRWLRPGFSMVVPPMERSHPRAIDIVQTIANGLSTAADPLERLARCHDATRGRFAELLAYARAHDRAAFDGVRAG